MSNSEDLFELSRWVEEAQLVGQEAKMERAAKLRLIAHNVSTLETALVNIPSARFDQFLCAAITGCARPYRDDRALDALVSDAVSVARACMKVPK